MFGVPHRVDYPNSRPRNAVVIGLGKGGDNIVEKIEATGFAHVEFHALGRSAVPSDPVAAIKAMGIDLQKALNHADMIFLIAKPGDDIGLAPVVGKIGRERKIPVTGIFVVEPDRSALDTSIDENELRVLRSGVEMLVLVSDPSYIGAMLGALGC